MTPQSLRLRDALGEGLRGPPAHCGGKFAHSSTGAARGTPRPLPPGQRAGWLQVKETLLAGLHRPLGSPSKHVHVVVHPGDDVARHVRGAVGDIDDLLCTEDAVPDVELAELPNKCLRGIEPATNCVLGKGDRARGGRLRADVSVPSPRRVTGLAGERQPGRDVGQGQTPPD